MTVLIDALTTDLVPQQSISAWWLLDIATLNFNAVGAFSLVLPAVAENWKLVTFDDQGEFQPQALLVNWDNVFQVPLLAEQWEHDLTVDPNTGIITETITLSGADFLALLANRLVFPNGTDRWTAQTTVPRTVTGPAETVIKTLVTENMVTAGDADRIVPNFTVATDLGRGGTVSYTVTPPLPSSGSNMLAGDSASFEGSLGTWDAGTNCTLARTTAHAHSGTHSAMLTASGSGDMNANSCPAASIGTQGCQVLPGDSVTAAVWFRAGPSGTARTCNAGVSWYDDTGTLLETDWNNGPADKTSGWVQVTANFAAPDNAAFGRLEAQVQNCGPGEIHYIDDAGFTDNGLQSGATSTANLGDSLMDMVRAVAAQSQIGVQITLSGTNLVFDCYIPQDLSAEAVFSTSLGNLRGDTISDATPTTDVVLMEDGASAFTEHDTSGPAPADPWRRVEMFDDQTSTTTTSDLTAAYTSDLQQGESVHQLVITATDIPLLRFGKTVGPVQGYGLGDTVTVAIPTTPAESISYTDIVSAVELTAGSQAEGTVYMGSTAGVQVSGASYGSYYELVTPTIGTASASATDQTAISQLAALVRKIDKAVARARKAGQ